MQYSYLRRLGKIAVMSRRILIKILRYQSRFLSHAIDFALVYMQFHFGERVGTLGEQEINDIF